MVTYEIPFDQVSDGMWLVIANHADERHFASRVDALLFAVTAAKDLARLGKSSLVSVEGADGRWRAFDRNMKLYE